jgi:hypothetical protein
MSLQEIDQLAVEWRAGNIENPDWWAAEGHRLLRGARRMVSRWPKVMRRVGRRPPTDQAIRTLRKEIHVFAPTFALFAGFAVENLLKGLLMMQARASGRACFLEPDGRLASDFVTHELSELAKRAGIHGALSVPESVVLEMLERAATWDGRYRFAVRPDDQRAMTQHSEKETIASREFLSLDIPVHVESLVEKVQAAMETARVNRPKVKPLRPRDVAARVNEGHRLDVLAARGLSEEEFQKLSPDLVDFRDPGNHFTEYDSAELDLALWVIHSANAYSQGFMPNTNVQNEAEQWLCHSVRTTPWTWTKAWRTFGEAWRGWKSQPTIPTPGERTRKQ